jgi:hypothetical protein
MTGRSIAEVSHAAVATILIEAGSPRDPRSAVGRYEKRLPNAR